jgi:hypothetical protein
MVSRLNPKVNATPVHDIAVFVQLASAEVLPAGALSKTSD